MGDTWRVCIFLKLTKGQPYINLMFGVSINSICCFSKYVFLKAPLFELSYNCHVFMESGHCIIIIAVLYICIICESLVFLKMLRFNQLQDNGHCSIR